MENTNKRNIETRARPGLSHREGRHEENSSVVIIKICFFLLANVGAVFIKKSMGDKYFFA